MRYNRDMEELTKHQLILVALLISFVTSLATGIVTVSLMNQAPQGVAQTINNVIERTIQQVAPQPASVADASSSPDENPTPLEAVVQSINSSIVHIENRSNRMPLALGVTVSSSGVIATSRAALGGVSDVQAVLIDGNRIPMSIVQFQAAGDVVFLAPSVRLSPQPNFSPVTFSAHSELGKAVFTLSGSSTVSLGVGVITDSGEWIGTTIPATRTSLGGPLFDAYGNLVGIRLASAGAEIPNSGAWFYALPRIRTAIPILK